MRKPDFKVMFKIIGSFVTVLLLVYVFSFALGSNETLIVESFRTFLKKANVPVGAFQNADSLNIISSFEVERQWLAHLELKNKVSIIELEQATKSFPCDEPGLTIRSTVDLGVVKFIDVYNQPCEDVVVVKAVLVWSGFNWKVFYSKVSGMA